MTSSSFIEGQIMTDALEQGERKGEESATHNESGGETSAMNPVVLKKELSGREESATHNESGGEANATNPVLITRELSEDNLSGEKDKYSRYIPLLKATLRGDWNIAKEFFEKDENAITAPITAELETALYMATGTGPKAVHFVEELLKLMPAEALLQKDNAGNTPLHLGAWVGNSKAARLLVKKNPALLSIPSKPGLLPVHYAAMITEKKTLSYLWKETKKDAAAVSVLFSSGSEGLGAELLINVITSGFYNVALDLVHLYPKLATSRSRDGNDCGLKAIARKVSAFRSGRHKNFWDGILYPLVPVKLKKYAEDPDRIEIEDPIVNKSQFLVQKYDWACFLGKTFFIHENQKLQDMLWKVFYLLVPHLKCIREYKKTDHQALQLVKILIKKMTPSNEYSLLVTGAILDATRLGIHEVVEEIVEVFPKLAWARDSEDRSLLQRAVIERQENIFNLIYQMSDHKKSATMVIDKSRNNILHLAGGLAPLKKRNLVCGAALQMQRELQWFKVVEKLILPNYIEMQNNKKETPAEVFTREHEKLVDEGGKWMKDTAESCTISAALIATVVFASAITVPGGIDSLNGLPILSKEMAFKIFFIADALSLFTSTTSLLLFLSILTSRYAEDDFLEVLPKRLIIGLVTLFLSITTMMVTFSMSLQLVLGQKKAWILLPVAALACMPVASFVSLQFPLLVELISSTYGRGIFGKKNDRPFF